MLRTNLVKKKSMHARQQTQAARERTATASTVLASMIVKRHSAAVRAARYHSLRSKCLQRTATALQNVLLSWSKVSCCLLVKC
jgi:hypothetical protein